MNKNRLFFSHIFLLFFFVWGCSSQPAQENIPKQEINLEDANEDKDFELKLFKYENLLSKFPSPLDIILDIHSFHTPFNKNLLNPSENVSNYITSYKASLNLGVYGVNLCYLVSYDQSQDALSYLKVSKLLSDKLGVPTAFNEELFLHYEKFKGNRDSLIDIIYKSFDEIDRSLRSNKQLNNAIYVSIGGWIEGLYIAIDIAKNKPKNENNLLYQRIWEQKVHLESLIDLLGNFNHEPNMIQINTDLQEIYKVYAQLKTPSEISESELPAIAIKVADFRNKIVTP